MVDYKKLYSIMVDASERAMAILEEAEQKCEELYIQQEGAETPDLEEAEKTELPE